MQGATGGDVAVINHGDIDANPSFPSIAAMPMPTVSGCRPCTPARCRHRKPRHIAANVSTYAGITGTTAIQAYGDHATITNAAGATITATALTELLGAANTTGIDAGAKYDVSIVNDGTITAYGHAEQGWPDPDGGQHISAAGAVGVYVAAGGFFTFGTATIANNGDITATAIAEKNITFFNGLAGATGIWARATSDAIILNNGNVAATAIADIGNVGAFGVIANGELGSTVVNGDGASIAAYAHAGSVYSDFYGARALSMGIEVFGTRDGVVYNDGSIDAQAIATPDGGPNPGPSLATPLASKCERAAPACW